MRKLDAAKKEIKNQLDIFCSDTKLTLRMFGYIITREDKYMQPETIEQKEMLLNYMKTKIKTWHIVINSESLAAATKYNILILTAMFLVQTKNPNLVHADAALILINAILASSGIDKLCEYERTRDILERQLKRENNKDKIVE